MRQSRRVRLRARLRTAGAALAATFRLRNLRRARRSVAYGAREYLCFYLAMLIIGTGFFVIALGADAELEHTWRQITDNYDYHTGRSDVLLNTAIDNTIFAYIYRLR